MLGSVKHKAGWIWYAGGKHPAAKDFLKIGPRDRLLQAFADWVAGGFRQWSTQNNPKTAQNSWRFWTKAVRKQHLICGVSRDSCDSFGRSFPLVVVGSGHLKDWQAHWELLPLVLDKTWQQMAYLSTKRLLDFSHLEDEVRRLPFPDGQLVRLKSGWSPNRRPRLRRFSDRRNTAEKYNIRPVGSTGGHYSVSKRFPK
jgi:type VI secretion system protein VasJ